MQPCLSEAEYRVATNNYGLEVARLVEVVSVEVTRADGSVWRAQLHVFEAPGAPTARHCFVWPEALDDTTTAIHAVLAEPPITSAEDAVRSQLR